ncbi:MAG TPA: hypothetical protein VEC56_07300, partial [Candidatus Krumholzibacteria bacterium]|nr:hypothetical protein [Candidatus Krumholzibacteria bacterium]
LAKMGLVPQGDMTWQERIQSEFVEASGRLYAGQSSTFAAVMAREGSFELVFLSELGDGTWLATGFADEIDRELVTVSADGHVLTHPRVRIENRDEPVAKIAAAHQAKLRKPPAPPKAAPTDPASVRGAFDRFLTAVYG